MINETPFVNSRILICDVRGDIGPNNPSFILTNLDTFELDCAVDGACQPGLLNTNTMANVGNLTMICGNGTACNETLTKVCTSLLTKILLSLFFSGPSWSVITRHL